MPDALDTQTADTPPPAELLERVTSVFGTTRENGTVPAGDACPVEATARAVADAGLFKLAVPRRYGGHESSVNTMLDVTSTVAESDASAAWAVGLVNVSCWITGLFGLQAQDEVWANNPDARVTGVFAPSGESAEVEGGCVISGRWYYNWASWPAEWAIVGFPRSDGDGKVVDYCFALVPMSDLRVAHAGPVQKGVPAKGAAQADCLIAEEVFVPEHRILSATEANNGAVRNELAAREPLYRSALMPVLMLMLIGPQLGLAREALRIVRSQAPERVVSGTVYERQSESVAFQMRLARAAVMIDTGHLHAHRAAGEIDTLARSGENMDQQVRARVHADAGWVVENLRGAIDMLRTAHGTGGLTASQSLEDIWRYSATAGLHALVTPDTRFETYGKVLLGIDDAVVPLL
ncbi:acyl-CoA dehydrogenase family protein [Streptomyces sp. NPDC056296]|uniref:acyl-CoA dehydrogenase family protein n=1 Tax=Streptomyces sp. NPDC056296 TaxID=3345775 RepID=UPI0035D5F001